MNIEALSMESAEQVFLSLCDRIKEGGGPEARTRLLRQNKLFVRKRIDYLVDDFFELSLFAGFNCYEAWTPAAGIITGIGTIDGHRFMIIANDATVKAGCYFPMTVKKHRRALMIAWENRLPCIYLVDSGGAYLPLQHELFADEQGFGSLFYLQAALKRDGIPQYSIVFGSATAGGAYIPAMADKILMIRGQSHLFLAGPDLVKAAIGEQTDKETLGGAKLHVETSRVAHVLCDDEYHALNQLRQLIPEKTTKSSPNITPLPPQCWQDDDMSQIITSILDQGSAEAFNPDEGKNMLCIHGRIGGIDVGIIANDGIIQVAEAAKSKQFLQVCQQQDKVVIFLQDTTGFMVGKTSEKKGIIRYGAELIHTLSDPSIRKITVITRSSYGAGNYAMCGRAYRPRFLFSWPQCQIGIMGKKQSAAVLSALQTKKQRSQQPPLESSIDTHSAFYASSQLWDDGIIVPEHTRQTLHLALQVINSSHGPSN